MTTSTVQAGAVLDHRAGEPGGTCYGFVWFDEPGATDPHTIGGPEGGTEVIRVGYTVGLGEGTAEFWQANGLKTTCCPPQQDARHSLARRGFGSGGLTFRYQRPTTTEV